MTLTEFLKTIADALRTKKGTTELINAQNFATEIINLPSGNGNSNVIELSDLPAVGVDDTKLYLANSNEISNIQVYYHDEASYCTLAELISAQLNVSPAITYSVVDALPESPSASDLTTFGTIYCYVYNDTAYVYGDAGAGEDWAPVSALVSQISGNTVTDKGRTEDIENENGDLAIYVYYEETSVQLIGSPKNSEVYDWDGTEWVEKGATVIQNGGWTGTPLLNGAHVESIYCNIELTPDEIDEIIRSANLPWISSDEIDIYPFFQLAVDGQTVLNVMLFDYIGLGYVAMDYSSGLAIFNTIKDEEMQSQVGFIGWNPEFVAINGILPINGDLVDDAMYGTHNFKLSGLVSLSPFIMLPGEENILSGEYYWTSLNVTENGTTDVKALIENERKIPTTIAVNITNTQWVDLIKGNLTELTAEDFEGIDTIRNSAFYDCTSLTSVAIGDSVTSIGNQAFYNCSGLTSVVIPDSVTSIGSNVFKGCSSLQYNVKDNLKYLGNENNPYLCLVEAVSTDITTASIDSNCKIIPAGAFANYSNLTSIVIPQSVSFISGSAFDNCTLLTIYCEAESQPSGWGSNWNSGCPVFWNCKGGGSTDEYDYYIAKDDTAHITTYRGKGGDIVVPETLSDAPVIDFGETFKNNTTITSIEIPNSVTTIDEGALSGCASLQSITIPFVGAVAGKTSSDTYQYPFGYIFGTSSYTGGTATTQYYYGARTSSTTNTTYYIPTSLKEVTVTGGNILYGAFGRCKGLTSVVVPNSAISISSDAFYGCSQLTSVVIPSSVTSIGDDAFDNCGSLTNVYITDLTAWCNISGLNNLMGSAGASSKNLYLNNELVTELIIPDSVTSIGSSAFRNCSGLISVVIGDSVTSIGSSAFYGCNKLVEVVNKSTHITVTKDSSNNGYVGYYALSVYNSGDTFESKLSHDNGYIVYTNDIEKLLVGHSGIEGNLVIPSYITKIYQCAFYYCSSLTSVVIPNSVTSVGYRAFEGCSSLTSVVIGDSVTSIGYQAFRNCRSLTSVEIPNSVTSIGDDAFDGCSRLEEITVSENNEVYSSLDGNVYSKDENTLILYAPGKKGEFIIPNHVTSIGSSAFRDCSSLTSLEIPNSVISIGFDAFRDCSSLTEVNYLGTIDQWVEIIEFNTEFSNPLMYAKQLKINGDVVTEVSLTTATKISNYAFSWDDSLTSVVIGDSVTSIGYDAFKRCSSLTSVVIGDSVTSIGGSAFYMCNSLTSMTFNGTIAQWNAIEKGANWNFGAPATVVVCTDGEVAL